MVTALVAWLFVWLLKQFRMGLSESGALTQLVCQHDSVQLAVVDQGRSHITTVTSTMLGPALTNSLLILGMPSPRLACEAGTS